MHSLNEEVNLVHDGRTKGNEYMNVEVSSLVMPDGAGLRFITVIFDA